MKRILLLAVMLSGALFSLGTSVGQDKSSPLRFTEHLLQDGYGYAFGIAVADLDGDGKLDITSADTTKDVFFWFAGDGKGKFSRQTISQPEPGWLERHVVGDIKGDGRPDVAIVKNLHRQLLWFENPGNPRQSKQWKRHIIATEFARAYDVVLADLARRGRLDVAASAWSGNQLAWFENPGKSDGKEWTKHMLDPDLRESRTIRAADFNRDGKIDLLGTGSAGNTVAWYENPGKLGLPWKKHVIDDQSARPIHGHTVDMDGDGDPDVVMALGFSAPAETKNTHLVAWYENLGAPGDGSRWHKHVIGRLDFAFEAVAADLNGDGHIDVVATSHGGGKVVWFENPGDPRKSPWKMHVIKENWPRASQVLVADLDGDGRPDIIAVAERGANELRWWRNEGRQK